MPDGTSTRTLALVGLIGILVVAVVAIPFAGGESLIRGMGNGGNKIYLDPVTDEVASAIALSEATPLVTDDVLLATYGAIKDRAEAGDLTAALVVFRVAEIQRSAKDD